MRVCGRQQHFRPLTVHRMNYCTAVVPFKHSCLAISEAKGKAPIKVVPWLVVDRWNYIINGLCVTMKIGDPRDCVSAVRA